MKKTVAILLSALILVSVVFNAFASNVTNRIYADNSMVEAGGHITIPVKIENNNGFMGFAIIVTYDDDVFCPVSVSKGLMLSGMFNDSIATSDGNSFKVVFTGTEDIVTDGVLFDAVFEVSDDASGEYEIEISYSQQDTFKEGWTNAVLNCEAAEVVVTVNGTTAPTTTQTAPTTEPTTENEEPSTKPDSEEITTQPITEPSTEPSTEPDDEPVDEKPLSVRMEEWVNGLPFPLNVILKILIVPVAFVISIFE